MHVDLLIWQLILSLFGAWTSILSTSHLIFNLSHLSPLFRTSQLKPHTWHITPLISHLLLMFFHLIFTPQPQTSSLTSDTWHLSSPTSRCYFPHLTYYLTLHSQKLTRHILKLWPPTSHPTNHISHLTTRTSHIMFAPQPSPSTCHA